MRILLLLNVLLFICSGYSKAQTTQDFDSVPEVKIVLSEKVKSPDIRKPIVDVIWKNLDKPSLYKKTDNFLHFFILGVSIDSHGKVNGLYTSNSLHKEVKELLSPLEEIENQMKSIVYIFKGYEKKILFIPILLYKLSDEPTTNRQSAYSEALNLWPTLPNNTMGQIVPLETFRLGYSHHSH